MSGSLWRGVEPPGGSIVLEHEPGGPVVHLRGDVDGPVVQGWDAERAVEAPSIVAVDVAALTYIDSAGLALLVRWARDRAHAGMPAVLRGATPRFDQVLDMIGVSSMFVREG